MTEAAAVLTVQEVADLLRLSRNSTYAAVRKGQIPSRRIGRRVLIPRLELERLLLGKLADSEPVPNTE